MIFIAGLIAGIFGIKVFLIIATIVVSLMIWNSEVEMRQFTKAINDPIMAKKWEERCKIGNMGIKF